MDPPEVVSVTSLLEPPVQPVPEPAPAAPAPPEVLDVLAIQHKRYPEPRCWSLVADVYLNVRGIDPLQVSTVTETIREASRTFHLKLHKDAQGLHRVEQPVELCIVLMWPTDRRSHAHCGIFYGGKVLHATETATLWQDLASLKDSYRAMEFWAP